VVDADRAERITFDAAVDRYPIWSADGTKIVFDSTRKGVRDLYQKVLDNTDAEQVLLGTAKNKVAADWSPDGRYVSYVETDPHAAFDIWMLPLDGDRKPFVFLKTPFDERRAVFSPNGRWVAYHSNESGQSEIYVRPFPGPGGQRQVSTGGGMYAQWAPDKRELYYLAPDGTLMAAPVAIDGPVFEYRRPAPLFRTRVFGDGADPNAGLNYCVSRDGRFLINTVLDDAAVTPITLIQNWTPPASGR
jgi:Tol biopolymer transport system component